MIMAQKMHKIKERARPYLQWLLVNVTRPDKWSHNIQVTMAELAARSLHDRKIVGSKLAGSKSDLT